ncbi:MAG: carbohydrate-binding family 9-like protein [Phycisphaerales bacterium]|nr:carbohydrate-binding family 9-like protein [Phycisphaerales bacterium]
MIPSPHVPPTAQQPRSYSCLRASRAPEIDGRLNKPFWWSAPWTEDFVDIQGDAMPRPRFRTRAKLLWDDDHLYIGAELEEPHVWATLTHRDSIVYHDNDFEVFLNPTGDSHRYYEVEVNALNTIFDLFLPKPYRDGGPADHGWDVAGLQTAIHIDGTLNDPSDTDRGWSVEMAIPWPALDRHGGAAGPPADGEQWRVNFSRVQWDHRFADGRYEKIPARAEHNWVWSPQGIIDMHRPEQWGVVQFDAARAGPVPVRPDESLQARQVLHRIYYAQAAHRRAAGSWASSIEALTGRDVWLLQRGPRLSGPLDFRLTEAGWKARQAVRTSDGRIRTFCIRQDSLIWEDGTSPYDADA